MFSVAVSVIAIQSSPVPSKVLSLPAFIWKQLVGESVTWARDYATVDNAEVLQICNFISDNEDVRDFLLSRIVLIQIVELCN